MTDGDSTPGSVRDAAREQAKALRALHRRRDRQRRWFVRLGLVVLVLVVIVAVGAVLLFLRAPSQPGPLNMPSDGIRIGAGAVAERGAAVRADSTPTPHPATPTGVLDIRIYVDYQGASSGTFHRDNGDVIRAWLDAGTATVEIHPVALLTAQSSGTRYSPRAASAAGCFAQYAPDSFLAFHGALLSAQPEEGAEGLSDDEIIEVASAALSAADDEVSPEPTAESTTEGTTTEETTAADAPTAAEMAVLPEESVQVAPMQRIEDCIREERFRSWVVAATERATDGPLPGTELTAVVAAPTILVNGIPFDYDPAGDPTEFRKFVLRVTGNEYVEQSTPPPTPEPTETSEETPDEE